MLGIGIDTGGTCTDAVIYDYDTKEILGTGKALTTKSNLEIGIANALDTLPKELVAKAESIALSTTLATNACLENKGARAKLLLIGFQNGLMDHLQEVFAAYGMKDTTRFITLEARAEGVFSTPRDPDWDDLRRQAPAYFADCDSVGIVQVFPKANGGRFELTAMKILREELDIPVTISYEISNEIDILKTCAGTLLNAMLIPLISEFMTAIRHVCEARGLNIPISIILSSGTVVPASTAGQYPVETILCGPAASVVGGTALAGEDNGIVVDMGGTTTDIAIVRDQVPMPASGGIKIGQWRTMVQGIYVNTIGLGGDSAVLCDRHQLSLDTVRVIPLSVLAAQYDNVLPELRKLKQLKKFCGSSDYTYYVLLKDISDKLGYTEEERQLCAVLREKPLTETKLAERLGTYRRFLPTGRLESDGVIIRSGLTPTDMMILKGDFTLYDVSAARIAAGYLASDAQCEPEELPDKVYELVERKMYHALGKLILTQEFPRTAAFEEAQYLSPMLDAFYEQARTRCDDPASYESGEGVALLSTRLPLIGVGAPIHIFLPRVAQLLGTRAVLPRHAEVANALGAVVSRKVAHEQLIIKAEYEGETLAGYALPDEGRRHFFKSRSKAVEYGREAILRSIRKKAVLHGIEGEPKIDLVIKDYRIGHTEKGLILEIQLYATATEAE